MLAVGTRVCIVVRLKSLWVLSLRIGKPGKFGRTKRFASIRGAPGGCRCSKQAPFNGGSAGQTALKMVLLRRVMFDAMPRVMGCNFSK
jgi:hypothetical protein